MNVIDTKNAPGAIGPYSQAYEVNGAIYTSGQIPVNPADGTVPDGIENQAKQSWKKQEVSWEKYLKRPVFWQIWQILHHLMAFMASISPPNRREAVWQ